MCFITSVWHSARKMFCNLDQQYVLGRGDCAQHKVKKLLFALLRNRTESQLFELLSRASQLKSKSDDKLLNCPGLTDLLQKHAVLL